jgi:hypothetical protein
VLGVRCQSHLNQQIELVATHPPGGGRNNETAKKYAPFDSL